MQKIRARDLIFGFRLIYKNFFWDRPKKRAIPLIILAISSTVYIFVATLGAAAAHGWLGYAISISSALFVLGAWFVGVPTFDYLLYAKNDPERIKMLMRTIPQYYDSNI